MSPIITLGGSSTTDILAYVGQLVSDTWVLIALAVGLPLGFYVIKKLIALIPKGR